MRAAGKDDRERRRDIDEMEDSLEVQVVRHPGRAAARRCLLVSRPSSHTSHCRLGLYCDAMVARWASGYDLKVASNGLAQLVCHLDGE